MKNLNSLYPGWKIRISYDRSMDISMICELECVKNENSITNYNLYKIEEKIMQKFGLKRKKFFLNLKHILLI
jgi:hypothetical protein